MNNHLDRGSRREKKGWDCFLPLRAFQNLALCSSLRILEDRELLLIQARRRVGGVGELVTC